MCSYKNRDDLESVKDLAPLHFQLEGLRIQDKQKKQNFLEDRKKVFQLVHDIIWNISEVVTETLKMTSLKGQKTIIRLALLNDRVKGSGDLLFPWSQFLDNSSKIESTKFSQSNWFMDLLLNKTKPVTLYDDLWEKFSSIQTKKLSWKRILWKRKLLILTWSTVYYRIENSCSNLHGKCILIKGQRAGKLLEINPSVDYSTHHQSWLLGICLRSWQCTMCTETQNNSFIFRF